MNIALDYMTSPSDMNAAPPKSFVTNGIVEMAYSQSAIFVLFHEQK